jgi:hypothetical protein
MKAENLVYSAAANSLEISELQFTAPYGDILIAEDGSVNLGRVRKGEDAGDGEPEVVNPVEETAPGPAVTIGRVIVSDAAADFADLSLPLPFNAKIAALNGEISTIATTSSDRCRSAAR